MSDQIETAEELDALPPKSVLLDRDGWVVQRTLLFGWQALNGTRDIDNDDLLRDGAPFAVLHRPDRPSDLAAEVERLTIALAASTEAKRAAVVIGTDLLARSADHLVERDAARAELAALKAGIEGLAARDEDGPLPRRRIIPEALRALLTPAHEIPAHVCDSGNFDRTICPDPWAVDAANVAARDVEGSGSDE
jgi:hypothetical protein